jgi:hypothetical protein
MRTWIAGLSFLVACGGGAEPVTEAPPAATTGGEVTEAPPEEPVVMRTTTPVPVPQPAVARDDLGEPLQLLWDRTERAVAVRPPEPPSEGTLEAVEAWAAGPFVEWMAARRAAIAEAEDDVAFLVEAQPYERAVAAALFGYMYEDTAAGVRGAPVPVDVAADPELLEVYVQTLDEALMPYAQSSAEAYASCATTLAALRDPAWNEWGAYCVDRGREVIEVFGLTVDPAPEETTAEPAPR